MRTRQTTRGALLGIAVLMVGAVCGFAAPAAAQEWTLVGWNNLGMHCMDADFSLFAILPPFNTFHAQLIDPQGRLVGDPAAAGITVTYEGVADPDGSRNTTSIGKTNFWRYAPGLFGTALPENAGVAGFAMPGPGNAALPMRYDAASGWFIAEGVPITPYDDAGRKNYYPLMRLVARDRNGVVLTHTDIVLPVSDELSCKGCHGSGSDAAARPASGWASTPMRSATSASTCCNCTTTATSARRATRTRSRSAATVRSACSRAPRRTSRRRCAPPVMPPRRCPAVASPASHR